MIDEKAPANGGTGVNLHTGQEPGELGKNAGRALDAAHPQRMRDAVGPNRMKAGINDRIFDIAAGRRIVVTGIGKVFSEHRDESVHNGQSYQRPNMQKAPRWQPRGELREAEGETQRA
ncbi:hypothetical protein GCM10025785_14910 [Corynebacterium canis]